MGPRRFSGPRKYCCIFKSDEYFDLIQTIKEHKEEFSDLKVKIVDEFFYEKDVNKQGEEVMAEHA